MIGVTSAVCLIQLGNEGASASLPFWTVPITLFSFGVMAPLVGLRQQLASRWQQKWIILTVFCVIFLGVIRILLTVSVGDGRREIWEQPALVAIGAAVLFLIMNPTFLLPNWQKLTQKLSGRIRWLILGISFLVIAYFSRPGRSIVLPVLPRPADSPTILLAIAVIAAFAVYATRFIVGKDKAMITAALPAAAGAAFFALTRDFGTASALFFGSLTVLWAGDRPTAETAGSGGVDFSARLSIIIVSFVPFLVGASLAVLLGNRILHTPFFAVKDALGYSRQPPTPFVTGENWVIGPGFDASFFKHWSGTLSSAPDVLALIGHEAGMLGLLGMIIVFALLLFSLGRLARQTQNGTDSALAWGLVVFLGVQCFLAVETLIPGLLPVGEGPPLLSGGWASYLSDLVAIGLVIGLSRRERPADPVTQPAQQPVQPVQQPVQPSLSPTRNV